MESKSKNNKTKADGSFELTRVEQAARRGSSILAQKIKERPLWCAGIAAAAGFVLGGGLATPGALRLLRRGITVALQATVVPVVVSRLKEVLGDADGEREAA